MINKKCPKCKRILDITFFYKNKLHKYGVNVYCIECEKIRSAEKYLKNGHKSKNPEYNKEYNIKNKNILLQKRKIYQNTLNGKYYQYKNGSKNRNIDFDLTLEEFSLYWQKPCLYCDNNITTIGLDRKNNSYGYNVSNIVSCCSICNRVKLDMSQKQWFKYLKNLTDYYKNKNIQKIQLNESKIKEKYRKYKYRAKNKKIEFNLTFEEFKNIICCSCKYCGSVEKLTIDRVINSIGYIKNNCVSCCLYCNSGKRNILYDDFIKWIEKVALKWM